MSNSFLSPAPYSWILAYFRIGFYLHPPSGTGRRDWRRVVSLRRQRAVLLAITVVIIIVIVVFLFYHKKVPFGMDNDSFFLQNVFKGV